MEEQGQADGGTVGAVDLGQQVLGGVERGRHVGDRVVAAMGLAVTGQEAVERVLDLLRPGRAGPGCVAIADGGLPLRSQPLLHPWEPTAMAVLVDEPLWWWRGRRWCHLVSDESLDELHAFAARAGIPARGFQGDHYDIPEEHRPDVLAAGAIAGAQPRAATAAAGRRPAAVAGAAPGSRGRLSRRPRRPATAAGGRSPHAATTHRRGR